MPLIVPSNLPAVGFLEKENIFTISETKATHQDIRPLKILIVNLMPEKEVTELQLLRLLSNTPLQIEIELLNMESHTSKNTSEDHLARFYQTFSKIKHERFDGAIITGAPVENLDFEQVDYWKELTKVFDWLKTNVYSTIFVCWGAQAALYYFYKIPKYNYNKKVFGVFAHDTIIKNHQLLKGFDDNFFVPHSRYTHNRKEDIVKNNQLQILAESKEAGPCIIASSDDRLFFISGHFEYDENTLHNEYIRDIRKELKTDRPINYYIDDKSETPTHKWSSVANLLYYNWLNFSIYQKTPFDLNKIPIVKD